MGTTNRTPKMTNANFFKEGRKLVFNRKRKNKNNKIKKEKSPSRLKTQKSNLDKRVT